MPSLSQELQQLVTSTATLFRRIFYTQEVRLFSYSDLIAYDFEAFDVGAAVWAAGHKYIVLDPAAVPFDYDTAQEGYHIVTTDGTKLRYDPDGGAVFPQALGAVPLLPGLGYPSTDQHAAIQLAFDIAGKTTQTVDFGPYRWRCEATIVRKGVRIVRGNGCDVWFPTTGTYNKWRHNNGNEVGAEYMAIDCVGESLQFVGQIKITGAPIGNMRAASRMTIDQNMVAFGNSTGGMGELAFEGQIVVQGFRDWMFVPKNSDTGSSRQFARVTGQVRVRHCLTPVGTFLGGSNGSDDSNLNLRTDRCGGNGTVNESKVINTELNFGYFFGTGLTDKSSQTDAESSTFTVINSTTLQLSDDSVTQLTVGSIICLKTGWLRTSDNLVVPLVTRVTGKVGTTVTIDSKLPTNLTAGTSNITWFWNPPRINLTLAEFTAQSAYFEGYWDGVKMLDAASISCRSLKYGGVRCSGRYGAVIWTASDNISVECGVHRTALQSPMLAIFAFGMVRDTSTNTDHSTLVRLQMKFKDTDTVYHTKPVIGVDPTDYYSVNKVSRFGVAPMSRLNVVVDWTNKSSRYYLSQNGVLTERVGQDGLEVTGDLFLATSAKFGSLPKIVHLTDSAPTTVYSASELEPASGYRLVAVSGDSMDIAEALFTVEPDGTVHVSPLHNGNAECTFSADENEIQAIADRSSRTFRVSIVGRV